MSETKFHRFRYRSITIKDNRDGRAWPLSLEPRPAGVLDLAPSSSNRTNEADLKAIIVGGVSQPLRTVSALLAMQGCERNWDGFVGIAIGGKGQFEARVRDQAVSGVGQHRI